MAQTETRFDKFVKAQANRELPDIYAAQSRFKTSIEKLFDEVSTYLRDWSANGSITLVIDEVSISEDSLGNYSVPRLTILIGQERVVLQPIGTILIGARGRVDVLGSVATARLVLTDKNARGLHDLIHMKEVEGRNETAVEPARTEGVNALSWKIVYRSDNRFVDLSREGFLDLILAVSNG